jgi:capsular exopolysaccharide synthesis family protein
MSRIGDALKRAGAPDITAGLVDLSVPETLTDDVLAELPVNGNTGAVRQTGPTPPASEGASESTARAESQLFGSLGLDTKEKLVANPELPNVAVEQYRRLAAILHHAQEDRGIRRVLVASALAEEGKTLTATNLALTLSESYGRRVLLVDADLRRPGITHVFGLPHTEGLSTALYTIEQTKLALVQISDHLSLLPAGPPTSDPMAGLTSSRMATILGEASQAFEWVIIDSPPIGVLPDAKLLAAMADAALLVIRAGSTPFAAVQKAAESLGRERLLGVVLNRVDGSIAAPGEYYYRYYGYSGTDRRSPGLLHRLLRRSR